MGPEKGFTQAERASYLQRPIALLTAGLLVLLLPVAGCARRGPAEAESRETRLTEGDGMCLRPAFSPDGRTVAFSYREKGTPARYSVRLVPATGGVPSTIYSDSTGVVVRGWTPDGAGLYVMFEDKDPYLVRMDLKGTVVEKFPPRRLARLAAVSPDGGEFLYGVFNKDNWDLGVVAARADSYPEPLVATPAWEIDGCYGPGPREITVVTRTQYGAMTCEFSVFNRDTREFRPLPIPAARNEAPVWSPDRRFLAYSSDVGGQLDLWVLDAANGRSIQVASGPEDETRPDWSPDGRSLAFLRLQKTSHVYVADPATRSKRRLSQGSDFEYEPVLSDDGRFVVFGRDKGRRGGRQVTVLAWAPTDSGTVREIDLGGLSLNPSGGWSWSPDNREIACVADDGSGNVDIYRVPRDGGPPARVTVAPGVDVIPFWSPDGRMITYTRAAAGETQVWAIPSTGGTPIKLTEGPGVRQLSQWSRDSRRISYMNIRPDGVIEIRVTTLAVPRDDRLLLESQEVAYPSGWTRDGRYVLAWLYGKESSPMLACAADGSGETILIGVTREEPDGKGYFIEFTPEGRRFDRDVHQGGVHVFQAGDSYANVVLTRVDDVLAATAPPRAQRSP